MTFNYNLGFILTNHLKILINLNLKHVFFVCMFVCFFRKRFNQIRSSSFTKEGKENLSRISLFQWLHKAIEVRVALSMIPSFFVENGISTIMLNFSEC